MMKILVSEIWMYVSMYDYVNDVMAVLYGTFYYCT